ncbi:hypothetical protein DRQ53_02360 [bacterium]|nr:MAG: hypothetical protein DRQ32_05540 [bacterium]RKZ17826.1 MAG: hypothetical protein DRQ53_02360 [bacterium]
MSADRGKPDGLGPPLRGAARKKVLLRLSPELHEELRRWAGQEMRSLNSQMEYLLREAIKRRRGGG